MEAVVVNLTETVSNVSGSLFLPAETAKTWRHRLVHAIINSVASKRFYWVLALLILPSLWAGFIADDHFHATRFLAPHFMPLTRDASPFDMFSVSDGRQQTTLALMNDGLLPWWTHPHFRFQLWRPLAELSQWIDYKLWPQTPFLMHVHHLLWFALMLWMVSKFWRRFIDDTRIYSLTLVLFAVSANLSQVIVWLASRNTIMATTFGIAALLMHVKGRENEALKWRIGAVLAFALALCSSEFGLGASTWLFAWTLTLDEGPLWKRLLRLAPFGVLMAAWATLYVTHGEGTEFSDFYIDPVHSHTAYALALVERIPKILFLTLTGLPPALLGSTKIGGNGWLIAATFSGLFFWAVRHHIRNPRYRFLVLGALLSILPTAAGPSGGRTMGFVSLGLLPLVACLFMNWVNVGFRNTDNPRLTPVLAWPMLVLALLGALVTPATAALYRYNDSKNVTGPALRLPITKADKNKDIVLLNPNSIFFAILYPNVRATHHLPLSQAFYPLTSGQREITIKRDSRNSLVISPENGFMIEPQSYFVRPRTLPLQVGHPIRLTHLIVDPLSMTQDGRPSSVRVIFPGGVESSRYRILQCDRMQFIPFAIPAIGHKVTILPCER